MSELYFKEVKKGIEKEKLEIAIEKVFLKSTNNLEWLKKGDKVLLKPALNSPNPYPATTSPLAIKVIKRILEDNGAIVVIADQSGIGHVVVGKKGVIKGSSKDCYVKSKMGTEDDNFIEIEKQAWNSFKKIESKSWNNGFYITSLIDEVDHIINLPRVSTHVMAGVTLGFKNMVGLIREDSRVEFHNDGPFSFFIKSSGKKADIETSNINEDLFFEKMVEISTALKDKLRLTLFVADKIQLTIGPDKKIAFLKSKQIKPEIGYIFASKNPIATEIFGINMLIDEYKKLTRKEQLIDILIKKTNKHVKSLDKTSVLENPFVKHAIKLNLGSKDYKVEKL